MTRLHTRETQAPNGACGFESSAAAASPTDSSGCSRSGEFISQNLNGLRRTAQRTIQLFVARIDPGPAALPARLLAERQRRNQLPPILHDQRSRRPAHAGPARFRSDARAYPPHDRAEQPGRPAHRPHRWIARSARLSASPERACVPWRSTMPRRAKVPQSTSGRGQPRLPVFVEKILARHEHLPNSWPVDRHNRL